MRNDIARGSFSSEPVRLQIGNMENMNVKRTALLTAAMAAGFFTASQAYAAEPSAPAAKPDPVSESDVSAMPAPVEGVDTNAPLEGANSFTEAQVIARLEENGFTEITGLTLDDKGIWRGKAKHQGAMLDVAVDYRGNIVYGGQILAKPE